MSPEAHRVNVQEAKTHLSRLLRRVEAGEAIEIARAGRVIARLVRVEEAAPRKLGMMAGQVVLTEDAFAPLDDDALELWEAGA